MHDIFDTNNSFKKITGMKKYIIVIFILLSIPFEINAFSPPMLTGVQVKMDKEYLIISYNIDNFQDGVDIGINIFERSSKKLFTIKNDTMKGSFGIISPEEDYKIFIDLAFLPDDFNLEQYVCFPKLTFEGRIYYEMLKIPKGKHPAVIEDDLIEFERTGVFYISKFEVSNEQFAAFINDDGYEIKEYWLVKEGVMENQEVGWNFQGRFKMSAPFGWNLDEMHYWKSASSNFIYGPVTTLRWFEANAFCNWMSGTLPELYQMEVCFAKSSVENDSLCNPVCNEISDNGEYLIHYIQSNVAEWLLASPDSRMSVCGPGCREMYYLKNDNNNFSDYPITGMSCPLFCNENLGFRLVILPLNN